MPQAAGSSNSQHCFHEQAAVATRSARIGHFSREESFIFFHCESVRLKRSVANSSQSLDHSRRGHLNPLGSNGVSVGFGSSIYGTILARYRSA